MKKMQEDTIEIAGGSLQFIKENGEVIITAFNGLVGEVRIPGEIADCPVTAIAKKAFLSKKNFRRVILPDSIREVGDWAFAYCDRLKEVEFPLADIRFGRSVFMECGALQSLSVRGKSEAVSQLLAAAVTTACAPYLLQPEEAGDEKWLAKWDARMLTILHADDTEGYSRQVLCGEEDYGSTDLNAYTSGRRRIKVRLALLRLLYPEGLQDMVGRELSAYLQAHTKGCATEETWLVVLEEMGDSKAYFELLTCLGCVSKDNFAAMLEDMGEDHPEMKAFLLRYQAEALSGDDFFDSLEL